MTMTVVMETMTLQATTARTNYSIEVIKTKPNLIFFNVFLKFSKNKIVFFSMFVKENMSEVDETFVSVFKIDGKPILPPVVCSLFSKRIKPGSTIFTVFFLD